MGWRGAGVGFSLLISRRARLSTLNVRNTRANLPPIAAAVASHSAPAQSGGTHAQNAGATPGWGEVTALATGDPGVRRWCWLRQLTNKRRKTRPLFISQLFAAPFSLALARCLRGARTRRHVGQGQPHGARLALVCRLFAACLPCGCGLTSSGAKGFGCVCVSDSQGRLLPAEERPPGGRLVPSFLHAASVTWAPLAAAFGARYRNCWLIGDFISIF